MREGDVVRAVSEVTEKDFTSPGKLHVHASPGDLGRVRGVDGEWATVTFERSGTTSDCHASELETIPTAAVA